MNATFPPKAEQNGHTTEAPIPTCAELKAAVLPPLEAFRARLTEHLRKHPDACPGLIADAVNLGKYSGIKLAAGLLGGEDKVGLAWLAELQAEYAEYATEVDHETAPLPPTSNLADFRNAVRTETSKVATTAAMAMHSIDDKTVDAIGQLGFNAGVKAALGLIDGDLVAGDLPPALREPLRRFVTK